MNNDLTLKSFTVVKRFCGPEYSYVMSGLTARLMAVGEEVLNFPSGTFERFQELGIKLKDLVLMSRSATETAKISQIDNDVNSLLVSMIGIVRYTTKTTLKSKKEASEELYNVLKNYADVYRYAQNYKLGAVDSMLYDLSKPELAAHVETLGLQGEVEELTLKLAQYIVLLDARASHQIQNSADKCQTIRQEMDELLDVMSTCIKYAYFTNPTDELANLILSINKLLSDAETNYNQRMAQKKKEEPSDTGDAPEAPSQPSEEGEEATSV